VNNRGDRSSIETSNIKGTMLVSEVTSASCDSVGWHLEQSNDGTLRTRVHIAIRVTSAPQIIKTKLKDPRLAKYRAGDLVLWSRKGAGIRVRQRCLERDGKYVRGLTILGTAAGVDAAFIVDLQHAGGVEREDVAQPVRAGACDKIGVVGALGSSYSCRFGLLLQKFSCANLLLRGGFKLALLQTIDIRPK
jgi:hypothetical protein